MSYRNKTELSFVSSKKEGSITNDNSPQWYKEIDNKRILRLIIGVGLNGTGKTKMIQGLKYLRKIATLKPEKPSDRPDYSPFLLDEESKNKPTQMWISYYINNRNFLYYIKVSRERIEEEELKLQIGKGQRIYHRIYDDKTDTSIINFGTNCDLSKVDQRNLSINTINNATVMSVFGNMNLESKILKENYDYIQNRISFVHKGNKSLAEKLNTGDSAHDNKMKKLLLTLLHDIGTNIINYHIDESSINIEDLIKNGAPSFMIDELRKQFPTGIIENKVLRFEHSTSHGSRSLDSSLESLGTINIIRLLVVFYDVVLSKKSTCIDEIEAGIHSSALEFLLKMYLMIADECQIFVATHDLSLLNSKILRRDAVRTFSKDIDGTTTVQKHEYVHNTVNFYKRYNNEIREEIDKVMEDMNTYVPYQKIINK